MRIVGPLLVSLFALVGAWATGWVIGTVYVLGGW